MQLPHAIRWRHNKSKMADGRHIEKRFFLSHCISSRNQTISTKFGMQMQILIPRMVMWKKRKILRIQHGARTPSCKSFFLAVFQRHIVRLTQNLDGAKQNHMQTLDAMTQMIICPSRDQQLCSSDRVMALAMGREIYLAGGGGRWLNTLKWYAVQQWTIVICLRLERHLFWLTV